MSSSQKTNPRFGISGVGLFENDTKLNFLEIVEISKNL